MQNIIINWSSTRFRVLSVSHYECADRSANIHFLLITEGLPETRIKATSNADQAQNLHERGTMGRGCLREYMYL